MQTKDSKSTKLVFTVPEVAEIFGISLSHTYKLVREGAIPSITLGKRVLVTKEAIKAILGAI